MARARRYSVCSSPFSLSDISRGTGRFNLAQGIVASAIGIGAALSTALAGQVATAFGSATAFLALSVLAVLALLVVGLFMPETAEKGWKRYDG